RSRPRTGRSGRPSACPSGRRRVAHEDALARLEALAEVVGELGPAVGVLPGVLGHELLLDGRVVHELALRQEGRPVGLADGDARLGALRLDAAHAPRGRPRADPDGLAAVVEPDLGGLAELARLALALDVHVLALAQRLVDLRGQRGCRERGGEEHEGGRRGGQTAAHRGTVAAGAAGDQGSKYCPPPRKPLKARRGGDIVRVVFAVGLLTVLTVGSRADARTLRDQLPDAARAVGLPGGSAFDALADAL